MKARKSKLNDTLKEIIVWAIFLIIMTVAARVLPCYFSSLWTSTKEGFVSARQIKELKIGMSPEEVEKLLGKPETIQRWGEDKLLEYRYVTGTVIWGQRLKIYFDKDNRIEEITKN